MKKSRMVYGIVGLLVWFGGMGGSLNLPSLSAQGTMPNSQELWSIIQKQQQEIDALKKRLEMMEGKVTKTEEKIDMVADRTEESDTAVLSAYESKTKLSGYGELHYNNLQNAVPHGADKDEIDFHRFVLYVGHQFNDKIRFFSELEVEHSLAGESKPGEVEIEQAYLEFTLNDNHRARAGLFLIPVGILNETHEPTTFYGVERNPVESNIIPSTWWESGVGLQGELFKGVNYNLAYTSGLAVNNTYSIRDGRRKSASAPAEDGAVTGRLKWKIPGFELAATLHYEEDLTQDKNRGAMFNSDGLLTETHMVLNRGAFGLKALYAQWDLGKVNSATANGRDEQYGWYIEPSLKLNDSVGVFVRFNEWDTNAGDNRNSRMQQIDYGVNWWPHERVVLKVDYQDQQAPRGKITELDGFNLGVGYYF